MNLSETIQGSDCLADQPMIQVAAANLEIPEEQNAATSQGIPLEAGEPLAPEQAELFKNRVDLVRQLQELPHFTQEELESMSPAVQETVRTVRGVRSRLNAAIQRINGAITLKRSVKGVGFKKRGATLYMQSASSTFLRIWPKMNSDLRVFFSLGGVQLGAKEREAVRGVVMKRLVAMKERMDKVREDIAALRDALVRKDADFFSLMNEADEGLYFDAPASVHTELKVYTGEGDFARKLFIYYDKILQESQSLQWYGDAQLSERLAEMERQLRIDLLRLRLFVSSTIAHAMKWVVRRAEEIQKQEESLEAKAGEGTEPSHDGLSSAVNQDNGYAAGQSNND